MPESGKTREAFDMARALYPREEIYAYSSLTDGSQEWWQNYQGERCVILDELTTCGQTKKPRFAMERLQALLDRYEVLVPFKGGSAQFSAEMIILTSNFPPRDWYPDAMETQKLALLRRIDETRKFCMCTLDGEAIRDDEGNLLYNAVLDPENMRGKTDSVLQQTLARLNIDCGYTYPMDANNVLHIPIDRTRAARELLEEYVNSPDNIPMGLDDEEAV